MSLPAIAHETLRRVFGHEAFLEGQAEIIERLIAGEDLCVIMPTGAGKSLCYQLPALLKPGYTLIVSPLISLMKDQVDALRAKGIAAACLNSTLTQSERDDVIRRWQAGEVKLLYVAPERLRLAAFAQEIGRRPPDFLVVDEAHCISQWGHDFRPDYARIGQFIDKWRIPQVGGFTATATPLVKDDIVTQLHRPGMQSVVTGFTRPNLRFAVHHLGRQEEKLAFLERLLADPQPTIIYAATRKNVDLIANELGCIRYHAGLEDGPRHEAQNHFIEDDCPVIVATNAFGMGIDRPDIRRVVHYNIPGSLEAYYQEAGRAGRDGEDADCHLLFSYQDRFVHEFFIELSNPPEFVVHATWQVLLSLAAMQGPHLEITQAELAEQVAGAKNDQQMSAVLKVLETHGYVERGYRGANRGHLALLRPPGELLARYPKPTTQRAVFVRQMLRAWGNELTQGVDCSYEELESVTRLNADQVKRVLRALDGDDLVWTPPFAGRGITVLRPDEFSLDIDFTEMKRHMQMELKRLDLMFAYPSAPGCRQGYIIRYFGENLGDWRCQVCDQCQTATAAPRHQLKGEEEAIARTALAAVQMLDGRFGKNRIAQYLTGSRSKALLDAGLHHTELYDALGDYDQPTVIRLLESLLDAKCLRLSDNERYPCLMLTATGRQVLDGEQTIALRLSLASAPRKAPPAPPAAAVAVPDDLYELLRQLRNRLAEQRQVKPFEVFSNATIQELAKQRPVTAAEARSIAGIGPYKERTVLPHFLKAIADWRRETNR